jgi:hypothetical protein
MSAAETAARSGTSAKADPRAIKVSTFPNRRSRWHAKGTQRTGNRGRIGHCLSTMHRSMSSCAARCSSISSRPWTAPRKLAAFFEQAGATSLRSQTSLTGAIGSIWPFWVAGIPVGTIGPSKNLGAILTSASSRHGACRRCSNPLALPLSPQEAFTTRISSSEFQHFVGSPGAAKPGDSRRLWLAGVPCCLVFRSSL